MNSKLERWLETATYNLAPVAAQRVRAEYCADFEDAQEAGETDILSAWGDPRRVNRELRRVHLTVTEMKVLAALVPSPWGGAVNHWFAHIVRWSAPIFIGMYAYVGHEILGSTWLQAVAGAALFWTVPAVGLLWGERQATGSSTWEEAGVSGLCIAAGLFAVVLAMIMLVLWPGPLQMQGLLSGIIGLVLLVTLWSGGLWRKVRRAQQVA